MEFFKRLGLVDRKSWSWALFDWANSPFPTIMMTAVLPIYFADVLAQDLESHLRTAYWGYTNSVALIIIACLGPVLGAWGDMRPIKKRLIVIGVMLGMLGSLALAFVPPAKWWWGSAAFILGNIGYAVSEVFYESLLPHVAKRANLHRLSTAAFAVGYLGGGLLLALHLAWIEMPEAFGLPSKTAGVKAGFIAVAFWWGLFAIPLLRYVPEPQISDSADGSYSFFEPVKRNLRTLGSLMRYRNVFLFLLAFWCYSDGIGTIIKMAGIYGREVGIGTGHLIGAILMVQFLGVPFTFAFGALTERLGPHKTLFLGLGIYSIICVVAYFLTSAWQFWLLGFFLSMVQGGVQAVSRSVFASIIPLAQSAEFFGFYNISARFAGVIGPLMFGLLGQFLGTSRVSILFLVVLFIIGSLLLAKVELQPPTDEPAPAAT